MRKINILVWRKRGTTSSQKSRKSLSPEIGELAGWTLPILKEDNRGPRTPPAEPIIDVLEFNFAVTTRLLDWIGRPQEKVHDHEMKERVCWDASRTLCEDRPRFQTVDP